MIASLPRLPEVRRHPLAGTVRPMVRSSSPERTQAMPLIDLSRITRETLALLARTGPSAAAPPSPDLSAAVPMGGAPAEINAQGHDIGDPNHGIPLAAVPEHFFDQDKWNEVVSSLGSREKALHRISHPDHVTVVYMRRQVAQQQSAAGAKAREEERIYDLIQSLVQEFCALLLNGQYVATGFQPPSVERVTIPPELWRDLTLNFEDGVGRGCGYAFAHIRIAKVTDIPRQESNVAGRLVAWLSERRARHGSELKKTLVELAHREFGDEFTVRGFDAAYQQVYRRRRGRPRKAAE
jgi:hypothetical protein